MRVVEYQRAWDIQKSLAGKVLDGEIPGALILLEHPHVFTLGRRGKASDVLIDEEALQRLGATVHHIDRGGEATYHGPGQLVAYPILDLRDWKGGPVKYVHSLEEVLVHTLADFGIRGHRREGFPGIWVRDEKIAFIGVRISRGITSHGVSLNVDSDLSFYDHIVPCGMPQLAVTSMARVLGSNVDMEAVKRSFVARFAEGMGLDVLDTTSPNGI